LPENNNIFLEDINIIDYFKIYSDFINEPLLIIDHVGKILSVNNRAIEKFGYSHEEFTKINVFDLRSEGYKYDLGKTLNNADEFNGYNFHGHLKKKNGDIILCEISTRPIPSKNKLYQSIILDIDNRSKFEENVIKERNLYFTILENSPTLIWQSDLEGNIYYYNKSLLEFIGKPLELVLTSTRTKYIFQDDYINYIKHFLENIKKQKKFSSSYRLNYKNKEYHWIKEEVVPFRGQNDEIIGFIGFCYDIHENLINERIKSTIYDISDSIYTSEDLNGLLVKIHLSLNKLMHVDNIFFALIDKNKKMISFPYFVDKFDPPPQPRPFGKGMTDYVIRTQKTALVDAEKVNELIKQNEITMIGEPSVSWLGVPLFIYNELIGVLVVQSYTKGTFYSDEDKNILEFICEQIAIAIQRIRDKEQVQITESKFKNLFMSLTDAVAYNQLIFDENGNLVNFIIKDVNPIYYHHFNLNNDEFLNKPILDDSTKEKPSYFDIYIRVASSKIPESYETFVEEINKYFLVTVYCQNDDELITISKDITSEKQALFELEKQKHQIQQILDISEVMIGLVDFNGSLRSINRKGIELLEYDRDELIGKDWLELLNNDEFTKSFKSQFDDFSETKNKNIKKIEVAIITKNNKRINIYFQNVIMTDDYNNILGLLFSGIDITERKEFETEILNAKKKAEEASNLKSVILGNLSHELRTPLNGILGFAQLLIYDLKDTEELEMAQLIQKSGTRLLNSINSLLTLTELESDSLFVNLDKINLDRILGYNASTYEDMAKDKNLKFELIINSTDAICNIDEYLFNQILFNLVDNAIKYTNVGYIKITLDKESFDGEDWGVIRIIDTGVGISEIHAKHIFEAFRQGSEGIDRSYEGVGLGLTLTKKMMEKLYGRIELKSEVDNGTEFKLSFLLAKNY
jgi:PAS domain S-box-containing protein